MAPFNQYSLQAGLFSAVSSAFIIQIQPELQPDADDTTQALLRLLIHNVNGSIFTQPEIQIPQWTGPPSVIVAVQILLYASLFSTLLAALLAVLGKQWLMYYGAAGDRGTIEQRCLERQRKVDGLRRWGFNPVMQTFPLLLQLSLLLFAVALSIYLWTIHPSIASVVLSLTCLGIVLYVLLGFSALASPDSPFQAPFTSLLIIIAHMAKTAGMRSWREFQQFNWRVLKSRFKMNFTTLPSFIDSHNLPEESHTMQGLPNSLRKPALPHSAPLFNGNSPHEPSMVAYAVLWVLESSTDPELVTAAAGMASDPDIQWPLGADMESPLIRLSETFMACFDVDPKNRSITVRDGFMHRAVCCGVFSRLIVDPTRTRRSSKSSSGTIGLPRLQITTATRTSNYAAFWILFQARPTLLEGLQHRLS